jgi:Holliday junction resolvase RusA-like endonuclease
MKTTISVAPLSVNECWQGKRFKTPKYKAYEIQVLELLPPMDIPSPPYGIYFEFGFSNSLSDIDNPVKPVQDILQKKYGFNDRDIMEMHVVKRMVKKGSEYFAFEIKRIIDIENH